MKKIFAIIMAICLMASALCVTVFAADPAPGTVLRISAIDSNGDTVVIADHTVFEDGWNAAMELANDMEDYDYTRVVVDLYADWIANNGNFTDDAPWEANGPGFYNDSIYFNDDVVMTLNMNGHTIDADSSPRRDGEVMSIDTDADVIINDGTITGGGSFNGAGGIHIHSGAKVTLNNVNVVNNVVMDDDGGAIALYEGASLVMNGGSLKNNELWHDVVTCYGGALYAKESFVTLNNVEIKNNHTFYDNDLGAAIYADESTVVLNGCTIEENGKSNDAKQQYAAISIIHAEESSLTIKNSTFRKNGSLYYTEHSGPQNTKVYEDVSTLIYLDDSSLVMEACGVSENTLGYIIHSTDNSEFFVSSTNMTGNNAIVLKSSSHAIDSYFNGCTFSNNNSSSYAGEKYPFLKYSFNVNSPVSFYNCNMGNSTYSKSANVKFINQNLDSGVVLTISGRKADGTVVKVEDHHSFETGWAAAMELATDGYWMFMNLYEYVVVDMHTDWIASKGRFTNATINGIGFNSDTIHVSENACLMLNMNGYKIDRGLTEAEANGEVMYIAYGADVVINNGTITGGYSDNGAGGIHISGNAKVTLNNVHVDGNKVENDDGAGIAVYGGATLTVNGGSISNNVSVAGFTLSALCGGGIYVEDSTVSLNGVTLKNNSCESEYIDEMYGSAIYSIDSTVTLKDCTVEGNGVTKENANFFCTATIYAEESTIVIENTSIIGNGAKNGWQTSDYHPYKGSAVICGENSELTITGGKFADNDQVFLFSLWNTMTSVNGIDFTDNNSLVMSVREASAEESVFANCKFSAGPAFNEFEHDFRFADKVERVTFIDCDFGDATFNNKNAVTFVGGTVSNSVGSMFGEGSLAMIVSIIALIASVASIVVNVAAKKNTAGSGKNDEE